MNDGQTDHATEKCAAMSGMMPPNENVRKTRRETAGDWIVSWSTERPACIVQHQLKCNQGEHNQSINQSISADRVYTARPSHE